MKIIISPAKKITDQNDFEYQNSYPLYLKEASVLYDHLKSLDLLKLKELYKTSMAITEKMYQTIRNADITRPYLTALFAYDGIQYKYMAPDVMNDDELAYLNEHLYILSGLYGALRPFDLIIPYRLEMGSKLSINDHKDLYAYWHDLYKLFEDELLINLASDEYSKAVTPCLNNVINIRFKEKTGNILLEKGVYVKVARGAMVRYMAVNKISDPITLKEFKELGYKFSDELSDDKEYIFVREG